MIWTIVMFVVLAVAVTGLVWVIIQAAGPTFEILADQAEARDREKQIRRELSRPPK